MINAFHFYFYYFHFFIQIDKSYFIDFREKGEEGNIDVKNISWLPEMHPDWGPNLQSRHMT